RVRSSRAGREDWRCSPPPASLRSPSPRSPAAPRSVRCASERREAGFAGPKRKFVAAPGPATYLGAMNPAPAPEILALIGGTPLVRLAGPSAEGGCEIFGKCAFAN